MALFNYFNRNPKVPFVGKIETEIKNGEDVTGPNHIEVFLQLQPPMQLVSCAASDNVPARTTVWPLE